MKKIFLSILAIAFATSVILPVFAEETTSPSPTSTPTSTIGQKVKQNIEKIREKAKNVVDLTCAQNIIDKRDTAIISAFDAYYSAAKQALETRKSALKSAWSISDKTQRKTALNAAWKSYKDTLKQIRQKLNTVKKDAWKNFYTERKTCKITGNSEDTGTESMDSSL